MRAVRPAPRDVRAVRLRLTMHVAGIVRATRGYRVVAELAGGRLALVCLGSTQPDAVARARQLAAELHPDAVGVRLQEWVGDLTTGYWRNVRTQRLLAPVTRPRRRRSA